MAGSRGISAKQIRIKAGVEKTTTVMVRRALDALQRTNQIKVFKSITASRGDSIQRNIKADEQNPTIPMYILFGVEPAEDLMGGVWYKDNKEYDTAFVTNICKFLLMQVRKAVSLCRSTRPRDLG
jgi:hypothetical protein